MHRSWRSCWPCPPCPPVVPVWERLGAGTEQSGTPRTRGSRWGKGLLLDTDQIQTIHLDFSQGNLCRSALGWLFNEAKVKTSLPTSALTAAFFRPLRWEGNRQKRKYRTDNDRQNHTGLWAQAQWPLCSPAVGKPVRKWQITAWWSPWNFKGHWNCDKLCVCAHAADAQVLQTNRSQKNRYKLKPNQTVCSALPPDSPDADSFAPSFKSIRDLHTRVHADAESFIR